MFPKLSGELISSLQPCSNKSRIVAIVSSADLCATSKTAKSKILFYNDNDLIKKTPYQHEVMSFVVCKS